MKNRAALRLPGFLLICLLALAGCQAGKPVNAARRIAAAPPETKTVSLDEVLVQLPCFKCHKLGAFLSGDGGFPHEKHQDFDIHCTQCHDIWGHQMPVIHLDACDGCHETKVITYGKPGMTVRFDHERHAKMFGCSECHPSRFRMKKGSDPMSMAALYAGKFCGGCHNGRQAFSSKQCMKCHEMKSFKETVKFPGGGMQPVAFSHENHTSMFACKDCHPKRFAMEFTPGKMKMDDMNKGKYCGGCHDGKAAFPVSECENCHKGKNN